MSFLENGGFCGLALYRTASLLSAPLGDKDGMSRLRTSNFGNCKLL